MRTIGSAVITGPTGAIGTALCRLLAQKRIRVFAVVHPGSVRSEHLLEMDGVELIRCDAAEADKLSRLIPGADAFFHLAWAKTVGSGRNDMDAQIRNIRYTVDACRAAFQLGCSVFVGAGSQAEYGRVDHALTSDTPCFPENGYGMAKLCAGQMSRAECEHLKVDHVWARILSVYGPYDRRGTMVMSTIRKLLDGEKPALTSGIQIWDYLYADDAAEGLFRMACSGKNGSVYPLGSGEARPLCEYIRCLRDSVNPALPLGFGEIPMADKQVMHLESDIRELQRDTGFTPKTSFAEGIRLTIDYVRRQDHA